MTTTDLPAARTAGGSPSPSTEGEAAADRTRPRTVIGVAGWLVGLVVFAALAYAIVPGGPLAAIVALLLYPVLVDTVVRPTFRRLALRNITRRKGEAVLVVLGSLLGTAIITASFVVGDSITEGLRQFAATRLGPVDEVVRVQDLSVLPAAEETVVVMPPAGVDGTVTIVSSSAAVAGTDPDRPRAEPSVALTEGDFDEMRGLGNDETITGMAAAGPTPSGDQAVINERLATDLDVDVGDTIEVFAYGDSLSLIVRDVLPEVGLAGYGSIETVGFGPSAVSPVFVPPGTIEGLAADSTVSGAAPPVGQVLVSNDGGVYGDADLSDAVTAELEELVAPVEGTEVLTPKQDFLTDAATTGDSLQELFFGIGSFSVIAGTLLLVNLFVMLAEERKVELGMLRAIGFKRNHITRTFALEGAGYGLTAAVLGATVGIGLGWAVSQVASRIGSPDDLAIDFPLAVEPTSLLLGGLIGLLISLATVWFTSIRISRLNVIAAIRDLPDPRPQQRGIGSALIGLVGVLVGGVIFLAGLASDSPFGVLAGMPIAAYSLIPMLTRFLPRKPVVLTISLLVLTWTVGVFSLFPEAMRGSDIMVFVLMGVILVASSVGLLAQVDHVWIAVNDHLTGVGGGLSARLGLAYPLARKFRTGMLLGMYAIVIFTMTFMSVFIGIFSQQAPLFAAEVGAGYEVFVFSNRANPVTVDDLLGQDGVAAVAPLSYGFAEFSADQEEGMWAVSGADETLTRFEPPALSARMSEFATDDEAWEAILAGESTDGLVYGAVDDFFLQGGGGPPSQLVRPGDVITMADPLSGDEIAVTVAGMTSSDFVFNGVIMEREFVDATLGPVAVENRHYVSVADGVDPEEVAASLAGVFVERGAESESFISRIEEELAEQESFFNLMRGYLALGLLIGIAGLGVVMVRAVRERRREIGMLRAMGFPSRVVRRAFLVEAGFIALQGAVIGVVLGLLTAYQVMVSSSTFGDQKLPFDVPWGVLALIVIVPLLASLLAAAVPATQAARIKPAVALRVTD
jgi:putative ABC transport system permease protein